MPGDDFMSQVSVLVVNAEEEAADAADASDDDSTYRFID